MIFTSYEEILKLSPMRSSFSLTLDIIELAMQKNKLKQMKTSVTISFILPANFRTRSKRRSASLMLYIRAIYWNRLQPLNRMYGPIIGLHF